MSETRRQHGLQTRLIHGAEPDNDTAAVSPPIYQTSTYRLHTPEEGAELAAQVAPAQFYTRYGSPNNKQVERMLADLEGAEAALAVAAGAAASSLAVVSNVKSGDHVVTQKTLYTATMSLMMHVLPGFGVEVTQVDGHDTEAFARAMRPNTKVVYTETPTNPTMELTDLRATADIAHAGGAIAIVDNTFASSYNQLPLKLGYDMAIHSATKYLNGHADVTAGVIVGTREMIDRTWEYLRIFGPVLHPFEAWLLRRGLMTYGMRMAAHNSNGMQVARFLEGHPAVERVYYPGLESHPQHELARAQMTGGFGGMLSFTLKGGYDAAYRAIGRTKVCILAVSVGGVETLITHPASMIHTHQTEAELQSAGINPSLIRLSVGVEDAEDIIEDLDRALGSNE
ncbi:MAG TPA: aminotransferase class I/II-fold pyridoxal phosphate-dependent enzyme [Chloroflexia bacterium]|nr:aminotransferase class I/II-fold pyridoxal phosphate-dependent enzyme [Chloroflexia bacterium]